MLASVWNSLSDWQSVLFVAIICYVVATYIINAIQHHGKKPLPGPWGVPFLGYLPFFTRNPSAKLNLLSKKYGDVFGISMLGNQCLVLNSYDSIKQIYVNRGLDFTGVPQKYTLIHWMSDSKGIFVAEGEAWTVHRRFLIQTLRQLGMGKNSLVTRIQDISEDLLEEFRSQNGEPFDPYSRLYNCSLNIICSLLFNKHYKKDDQEFKDIIFHTRKMTDRIGGFEAYLAQGYFVYLSPGYWTLGPTMDIIFKIIRKFLNHHRENLDELNPQDYLDNCLLKMAQKGSEPNEKDANRLHTEQYAIGNSVTLFIAGTETVTTSMYWFLLYMMVYPDIQQKVQQELDHVVGRERMPTWTDRTSLPYTEAVLAEMQRLASVVPIGLIHCNIEETEFRGFNIPRRTNVLANLWAANRDPKYWSRPEEFDPTRFLDNEGKFVSKEALIPFSIGKRACAGESVARMEIFLFFTSIMHQFKICPPVGVTPSLDFVATTLRKPSAYFMRAIPRG